MQQYGATEVRVEARNGQVWRPRDAAAVEALDWLLRVYVPTRAGCPASPQSLDGVPLSFGIGPAPALPELAKPYPCCAQPDDAPLEVAP
jgi:hypothetical protein